MQRSPVRHALPPSRATILALLLRCSAGALEHHGTDLLCDPFTSGGHELTLGTTCTAPEAPAGAPAEPFPTGAECKLAILSGGMARSGSTMQHSLLLSALKALRVHVKMNKYWNWHWHRAKVMSRAEMESTLRHAKHSINALDRKDVVVMKSHDFDPRMLRLCKSYLAFTTHRHPEEMLISAAGAFNGHLFQEHDAVHFLQVATDRQTCWRRYAAEDTSNAEMRANVSAVFHRYVEKIGIALHGDEYTRHLVGPVEMESILHAAVGNPSSAHKPRVAGGPSRHVRKRLFCKFRAWYLSYGYLPKPAD